MDLAYWLPLVWAAIIGIAVALYVILDGFVLGIGILFPFSRSEEHRDLMMNTAAPIWDGNQTWLVLGGGGLFVAFPKAYAVIMSALYLPVIFMLLALVFRGVAFEFRWVAKPKHALWDLAFAGGSIVAAFMQGVILGALLNGITVKDGAFAGATFDWLSPFALFSGAGVVAGYALLGACWLVMKSDGPVAERARSQAKTLLFILVAAMAIVSLWTPFQFERIAMRWFTWPNILALSPVPILSLLAMLRCYTALNNREDTTPFLSAIALFMLGYAGLVISNVPYLVPPSLTVWQAAAPPSSQLFMLVGTAIMLPVILGYTAFVYWTFRGKVTSGDGYH